MTQTDKGVGDPDDLVAVLRRMVGEPTTTTYSDATLATYVAYYPLEDARGEAPYVESETTPGSLETNEDWTPTYDLNAAAADIWDEKSATVAGNFDFAADGGNYSRSQYFQHCKQQARYYRSRRSWKTVTQRPEPLSQGSESIDDE